MKFLFGLLCVMLCCPSSSFNGVRQHKGSSRPHVGGISLTSKKLDELDGLVAGDKIFKVHSIGAAFFGGTLLLAPDLIIQSGPIAAFAYQQWSLFILAVAYITYYAPSLDKNAKTLLANAYFGMCTAEAGLYLFETLRMLFRTPLNVLLVDVSSLAVFTFLAVGYWRSGNTSLSKI